MLLTFHLINVFVKYTVACTPHKSSRFQGLLSHLTYSQPVPLSSPSTQAVGPHHYPRGILHTHLHLSVTLSWSREVDLFPPPHYTRSQGPAERDTPVRKTKLPLMSRNLPTTTTNISLLTLQPTAKINTMSCVNCAKVLPLAFYPAKPPTCTFLT